MLRNSKNHEGKVLAQQETCNPEKDSTQRSKKPEDPNYVSQAIYQKIEDLQKIEKKLLTENSELKKENQKVKVDNEKLMSKFNETKEQETPKESD